MRNLTVLLAAVVLAASAHAQTAAAPAKSTPATLLPAPQSDIAFVSKQMGVPVEGHFRKFDAQVAFDPKQPAAGTVAFSVDLGSATLGAPEFDAELGKAPWFNTPKFPQATFKSTAIKQTAPGKYDVAGQLSIKGSTRDVVVPVVLAQTNGVTTANGAFTLKRLEFKIGEGEWADTSMVANDVQVKFKLALRGVPAL